jgi:hypothetical protein
MGSCGLEDPPYNEPVDSSNVTRTSNYAVTFNLPSPDTGTVQLNFQSASTPSVSASGISLGSFFSNYNLYYKIYVSGSNNSSPDESTYTEINPQWNTDYSFFKPLTVTTDTSMIDSRFTVDRKYFRINTTSGPPLKRANELIAPQPDLNFFYSADLINPNYISTPSAPNTNYNSDVMSNTGSSDSAWAAMYIVHKGFREDTLTEFYSAPTFLGVFLLPNTINAKDVTVSDVAQDGTPTTPTTTITFVLSESISGLIAVQRGAVGNISINDSNPPSYLDVSPEAENLTNTGNAYTLKVTNGEAASSLVTGNTVTLLLSRNGYSFTPTNVPIEVYVYPKPYNAESNPVYPVNFVSATATPATGATTGITLTFNPPLYGLSASNISITNRAGEPVSGTFTSSSGGATWTLTLNTPVAVADAYTVTINEYPGIFDPTTISDVAVSGP